MRVFHKDFIKVLPNDYLLVQWQDLIKILTAIEKRSRHPSDPDGDDLDHRPGSDTGGDFLGTVPIFPAPA